MTPLPPTMTSKDWEKLCAERKEQQLQSIPKEWFVQLPPASQGNIMDIPDTCGLLTDRELEITNTTDVDTLLGKLALGLWTSVEVTTAFYKRAIVAQQLVRFHSRSRLKLQCTLNLDTPDELFNRNIR